MTDEADALSHEPTPGLSGWITHTDLSSTDPAATKAWCERVLGWTFVATVPTEDGAAYHLFAYSDQGGGGIRAVDSGEAPGSVPFVHVADARAVFDAAVEAGAEPLVPPRRVMAGVTTAVVRAPGGVSVGFSGP
jgi:predicted enzyme related to lactoylglutathione lyase